MAKFKPFWVISVNNWICDAAYSGRELKSRNPLPTFRRFSYIRSMDELKCFTKHDEISNEDLVKLRLEQNIENPAQ